MLPEIGSSLPDVWWPIAANQKKKKKKNENKKIEKMKKNIQKKNPHKIIMV